VRVYNCANNFETQSRTIQPIHNPLELLGDDAELNYKGQNDPPGAGVV
jgi:hypothetical protein